MEEPLHIFVSYSHLDNRWFDSKYQYNLIPWIEEALHRDRVVLWYDRNEQDGLHVGDSFREEIEQEIDRSQIAILLVSEAFLSSDFIQDIELPRILNHVEHHETRIIPILLEPCDWKRFDYLVSRQLLPGEPTPLIDYTDTDSQWARVRSQILKEIRITLDTVRKGQVKATFVPGSPPTVPPTFKTHVIDINPKGFPIKKFVWIGIAFIATVLVGVFFLFNNQFFDTSQIVPVGVSRTPILTSTWTISPTLTLLIPSTRTSTATITQPPGSTDTPTPTPNMSAFQWPLIQRDIFSENSHDWPVLGDQGVDPVFTQLNIANGKYTWSVQTKSNFPYTIISNSIPVTDFSVTIEVKLISTSSMDTDYGLILRYVNSSNYYYFAICTTGFTSSDTGSFSLNLYKGEWGILIPWTATDTILPAQSNRLSVVAEGDRFSLFINDRFVADYYNNAIPRGKTGLATDLFNVNDKAQISFDNFELRAP